MNRSAIIILGLSLLALVGAVLSFGWGASQAISGLDVEGNAKFQGEQGIIEIDAVSSYSVYVNSDFSCTDTTVSIHDEEWEYFFEDCDPIMNEPGWNMVGYFYPGVDGQLTVEAYHEIAIIHDMVYLEAWGGSKLLISVGLCCFGVVGAIIGILVMVMSKPDEIQHEIEIPPIVEQSTEDTPWWSDESLDESH